MTDEELEANVGLLSWLFGTREPDRVKVIDRIWMNGENRARAVAKELAGTLAAGRSVLLLAHFPSTLAALAPELIGTKLPHEPIPDGLSPEAALRLAAGAEPRVLFGLVRNLRLPEFPASDDAPESPLAVTLVERHFLRACEGRVAAFAGGLGARAAVTVHASLDDVLMKLFAGEWVTGVLKQLGMRDDEAIESAMVARRIRKAQDGFIPLVVEDEVLSDSPEEWFQLNRKA